ncbi:uncharacterized protein PITG_03572 [Phytophthora infestans T30-4]|uniref:Transmembrane protein n=1 Tax=Phytophthora infestans (strain T30-4) TaxID=403677 RepID=D0MXY5_PHYIT|nr:uncharacterized protein PITG_03572 [Phytophthora infestans T30-4]EEY66033.1 hypothetical protein PITG_03572 [Phytophthora infestans T30-4]|eukprot:XP_002906632.1 hypothetical protein PITG_03572 [Phytophthora infestans T30-4]
MEEEAHKLELEVLSSPLVASREAQFGFQINESVVYLILFSSTAVLHCAIFNFSSELRQFLQVDMYPFGIVLLLSWTFAGLIHFFGGLAGDLVRDRVLLLRRTAVLWGIAVLAFHVAAFQMSSLVSLVSMVSGLLCAGVAHGIVCPNVIALGVESKFSAESEASYLSDVSSTMSDEQQQHYDSGSHNFFTVCFAARLAGSTLVQGYYFVLVDVETFSADNEQTTVDSRGFHCLLLMSFGLMASLIYFCFQSWNYSHSDDFTSSNETIWTWSWTNLVRLCNRVLVGYALLAFVLMTLIGAGFSLVAVLLATRFSLPVRLVAFLLTVTGWLLTMVASSRQLNPTKKHLVRVSRRLGLRSRQLYLAIFAVAFICVSGCVAFLRAQLYSSMLAQVCQTRLLIPGTISTYFNPELLGTAVGTSSLVFIGLFRLLPSLASCPPVTRMCFAMLLYLVSVFLSSVVELYRRQALVSPFVLSRSCGAVHSEFTFIWTSPYMILLGASDALFRVSFQEACHDLVRGSFGSSSRRWTGTVQGAISLAEALGYTTALSLVAVLSRWLFQREPTDMALFFLLLTTVIALTHAMLNRIAARAQDYQRLYFSVR